MTEPTFNSMLERAKGAFGDCMEVGVHNGVSAIKWRYAFHGKDFYAFDTYCGIPVEKLMDYEQHLKSIGRQYKKPEEVVFESFRKHGITPVKGVFPDEVLNSIPKLIAFAYIDTDNYLTTLQALYLCRQRLSVGGCIVVHDYYHTDPKEGAPGVQKAVNEFMNKFPEYMLLVSDNKDYVMVTR